MSAVYLTVRASESPANRRVRASGAPAPRRLLPSAPVRAGGTVLGEDLLHALDAHAGDVRDRLAAGSGLSGGNYRLVTVGHDAFEVRARALEAATLSPEHAERRGVGRFRVLTSHTKSLLTRRRRARLRGSKQSGPAALERPGPGTEGVILDAF